VAKTGDVIHIAGDFPNEFAESKYTKSLRGAIAKDAENGWYRYDCYFALRVQGSDEMEVCMNFYKATLVVRNAISGLFFV